MFRSFNINSIISGHSPSPASQNKISWPLLLHNRVSHWPKFKLTPNKIVLQRIVWSGDGICIHGGQDNNYRVVWYQVSASNLFIHQCWHSVSRLGLASGIAQAGVGLGQFVIPPLAETLMEKWGLVSTFLVLSAVTGSGLGISKCHQGLILICERTFNFSVWACVFCSKNKYTDWEKNGWQSVIFT